MKKSISKTTTVKALKKLRRSLQSFPGKPEEEKRKS